MKTAKVPPGIAGQMMAEGGEVTFARFMELALTHPTEGYYSQADVLVGERGHFSTAPSLSPEFNQSAARLIEELVTAAADTPAGTVSDDTSAAAGDTAAREGTAVALRVNLVELGGGAGELAEAVLRRFGDQRPYLKEHVVYTIVEVGERLRTRQRVRLETLLEKGWRVAWSPSLAEGLQPGVTTVVVGNEFIDALPVHLVDVRGDEPREAWVAARTVEPRGSDGDDAEQGFELQEVWGTLSPEAEAELQALFGTGDASALEAHSHDGFIEFRSAVASLFEQLAATGAAACLLTIDYGCWFGAGGENTPYGRTLRGYYRHQLVDDPYARVGQQDLTADVDFRALDLHGRRTGFETVLYSSVARMLEGDAGPEKLEELRKKSHTSLEVDRRASILAKLLDERDLGGAFGVLLQVRG